MGCSVDAKGEVLDNISDIRYNIFCAESSDFTVNLMSGMREIPYAYDGVSNKKCEFGILTLNFKTKNLPKTFDYLLEIDGYEYAGILEENPYDHSYMTDIEKLVDCESAVYFSFGELIKNMVLNCESADWEIKYADALEIGYTCLETDLLKLFENKKFKAECYLKIICDKNSISNPFYWYFGVISQNGDNFSVIIDTKDGTIITQNN